MYIIVTQFVYVSSEKNCFYLNKYNGIINNKKLIPKTVTDKINTMGDFK
jgi:hypothetical protein